MILTEAKEKMLLIVLKTTFFKLMNNSVFGKTMENLRKRINVRLVNNAKDNVTYINNFVAIHETKPVITINRSIYVGFNIVHLSKY